MSLDVITCPQCLSESQRSEIKGTGVFVAERYDRGFYDSLGSWHLHNTRNAQVELECSRGHRFVHVVVNKCWCGWRNVEAQV